MKQVTLILAALLFGFAVAPSLHAGSITYEFAGTLSQASVFNASLPAGVTSGAAFTGIFSFNDSTAASFTSSGNPPQFQNYAGALTGFTLQIGSTSYTLNGVQNQFGQGSSQMVQVVNMLNAGPNSFQDAFSATAESHNNSDPTHQQQARLQLGLVSQASNPTGTTSTALAGIQLNLADFTSFTNVLVEVSDFNSVTQQYNSDYLINGRITSLSSVSTPEPASMTLLGIGIVGMAGYGWRKRNRAPA